MAANAYAPSVEQVIVAMRERLDAAMPLDEMASIAYLSPFHFARTFRRLVGVPPCEFHTALRLEQAKRLLLTTDLSVTDVCCEVGYSSLGTFTTRFTQLVGVTPGRLRRADRMAEQVGRGLEVLQRREADGAGIIPLAAGLHGRVVAPDLAARLTFIGLFPSPLPCGRPVAGVVLSAPGPFHIAGIPDGRYYALSAAVPMGAPPEQMMLPDAGLRVAVVDDPIVVQQGRAGRRVDVMLRPPRVTDPPVVVALPFLLPGV